MDRQVLRNLQFNKWTLAVITLGFALNFGLTRAGEHKTMSWKDINVVRSWKEVIFGTVLAQSGKAVRKYRRRKVHH